MLKSIRKRSAGSETRVSAYRWLAQFRGKRIAGVPGPLGAVVLVGLGETAPLRSRLGSCCVLLRITAALAWPWLGDRPGHGQVCRRGAVFGLKRCLDPVDLSWPEASSCNFGVSIGFSWNWVGSDVISPMGFSVHAEAARPSGVRSSAETAFGSVFNTHGVRINHTA